MIVIRTKIELMLRSVDRSFSPFPIEAPYCSNLLQTGCRTAIASPVGEARLFWSVNRQDFRQHALLFFPAEQRGAWLIDGLKVLMLPSLQCLFLHRVAHVLHELGAHFIAKLFVAINATLYKAYISPCSQIVAGTIIPHTAGIYFDGTCGERVMLLAHITVCAATPRIAYCKLAADCPIIGNDVWVGVKAVIVGPVKVGDDAFIGATVVINHDVPVGARLSQRPSRHSINLRRSDCI